MNIQPRPLAALLVLCAACTANAQVPQFPNIDLNAMPYMDTLPGFPDMNQPLPAGNWGAVLVPVPTILRQHLPTLDSNQGLLVTQVSPWGQASLKYGLAAGDIVLQIGKEAVTTLKSVPAVPSEKIVVLRRGEIATLTERQQPWVAGAPVTSGAVTARAFAGGNESIAVSSSGNQVTIQMSLGGQLKTPIHFQGTRQKILADLKKSGLPQAVQQRVLNAIR